MRGGSGVSTAVGSGGGSGGGYCVGRSRGEDRRGCPRQITAHIPHWDVSSVQVAGSTRPAQKEQLQRYSRRERIAWRAKRYASAFCRCAKKRSTLSAMAHW